MQVGSKGTIAIKLDPVEDTVSQIWLDHPGIGIQELCLEITKRLPPPWPGKKRVKAAKVVVPYRRLPDILELLEPSTSTNIVPAAAAAAAADFDSQKQIFVKQKLEQRQSHRLARDFARADRIEKGLEAMGISIDDTNKTWTRGPPKADMPNLLDFENNNKNGDSKSNGKNYNGDDDGRGVPCSFCGRMFGSRNLMFKHLRDPVSGCGTSIFASGQAIAEPPSLIEKQQKRNELKATAASAADSSSRRNTGTTARHASASACLWIGDLPLKWTRAGGRYKRIRALLYAYTPRDVPRPWIKTVVRKAYRRRREDVTTGINDENTNSNDADRNCENNTHVESKQMGTKNDPYLGYVIVVYRDAAEAATVLAAMERIKVCVQTVYTTDMLESKKNDLTDLLPENEPPFFLKVRTVENSDTSAAAIPEPWSNDLEPKKNTNDNGKEKHGNSNNNNNIGLDPPLSEQLRPLAIDELLQRSTKNLQNHHTQHDLEVEEGTHIVGNNKNNDTHNNDEKMNHNTALSFAMLAYKDTGRLPRREVRLRGRLVPEDIRDSLLQLLETLRWPVPNQRQGLSAERYLVLPTNITNDPFYSDLRDACKILMEWAAPGYYYSGIAVTKNLVASPHIDDRDQSYQYAMSLGDFTSGGDLCVEGGGECTTKVTNGGHERDTANAADDWVNVVETRNRIARVDGRHVHWVRTWQGGDRYSLIFYDTSDRQPTPRNQSGVFPEDFKCNEGKDL